MPFFNLHRRGWAAHLILSILLLGLFTGCGGGGGGVDSSAGGDGTAIQSGGLSFNFIRVQSTLEVPNATTELRFDFFSGSGGTGGVTQPSQTLGFAPQITISPVNSATRSVVVTALQDGVPLVRGVADVSVAPGSVTPVSFDLTEVVQASRLELTPAAATIARGATRQFTATVVFSNTFRVENPSGVKFSATGAASINETTGLATAGSVQGTATISAIYGGKSDTVTLTVDDNSPDPDGNAAPALSFGTDELRIRQQDEVFPFPTAMIIDEQANFNGGQLLVSLAPGSPTGLTLKAPAVAIGSVLVTGSSDRLEVALDQRATPTSVASFLRGIIVQGSSSTDVLGEGAFLVSLNDGGVGTAAAQTTSKTRNFLILGPEALSLTVNPNTPISSTNFHSLQAAIDEVAQVQGAFGSLIVAEAADFDSEGVITIMNTPSLNFLLLRGANFGHPVGSAAIGSDPTSPLALSDVQGFEVSSNGVVIDGFSSGVINDRRASQGVICRGIGLTARNNYIVADGVTSGTGIELNQPRAGAVTLSGNHIEGFGTGLQVTSRYQEDPVVVKNNLILANDDGFYLTRDGAVEITGNSFVQTQSRDFYVDLVGDGDGTSGITGNDFYANVFANAPGVESKVLHLENNWWGQTTGPRSGQVTFVQSATIATDPFSTLPFTNYP